MVGLDDKDEFTKGGFTIEEVNRMLDRMEYIRSSFEGDPHRKKTFQNIFNTLTRIKADLEVVR
jgi:hypothetical protein